MYYKYSPRRPLFCAEVSNLGVSDELNEAEIYGLNEDGEPFKFFLIGEKIVPYIWRKDENNITVIILF